MHSSGETRSPRKKWRAEENLSAQRNLFDKMLIHRQEVQDLREGKTHPLVMIANSLVIAGLPYRPTFAPKITRTVKTGSGTIQVTFHALATDKMGVSIPMARGTDRTYLHWAIDRAIKLKNRFVSFNSAREFFDDLEMSTSGENYESLRSTQERLAGLAIFIQRFGDVTDRGIMTVFERSRLPASMSRAPEMIDGPMGLLFSESFFKEISNRPVPFLLPLLRTLHRKPQMQDYVLFLHHRSYSSESTSRIPWGMLRDQLWQNDRTTQRMRLRMDEAIRLLGIAWPELNATTTKQGLVIGPPSNNQHLIPEFFLKRTRLAS